MSAHTIEAEKNSATPAVPKSKNKRALANEAKPATLYFPEARKP